MNYCNIKSAPANKQLDYENDVDVTLTYISSNFVDLPIWILNQIYEENIS